MGWEPAAGSGVDDAQARWAGTQAGTFLIDAVHREVDGATLDPVQVLMDPQSPGEAIYAIAAVQGPLRAYLATAWGRAGHVAAREIVSYPGIDQARQAAQALLEQRRQSAGGGRHYTLIGTLAPDSPGQGGG